METKQETKHPVGFIIFTNFFEYDKCLEFCFQRRIIYTAESVALNYYRLVLFTFSDFKMVSTFARDVSPNAMVVNSIE